MQPVFVAWVACMISYHFCVAGDVKQIEPFMKWLRKAYNKE